MTKEPSEEKPRSWEDRFYTEFVYEKENNWIHSVNGLSLEDFIRQVEQDTREKCDAEYAMAMECINESMNDQDEEHKAELKKTREATLKEVLKIVEQAEHDDDTYSISGKVKALIQSKL